MDIGLPLHYMPSCYLMPLFYCSSLSWVLINGGVILLTISLALYIAISIHIPSKLGISDVAMGYLGLNHLRYFLYFAMGYAIRSYEVHVERYADVVLAFCIVAYIVINTFATSIAGFSSLFFALLSSTIPVYIIYRVFRINGEYFNQHSKLNSFIQLLGKRTLDIYFIHYIFIYSNLNNFLPNFQSIDSPFIEFAYAAFGALIIIIASLAVSQLFRSSRLLARYLFGSK